MQNALEEVVHDVFDRLLLNRAHFCHCPQCRDDVVAHALNKVRPRYIGGSSIGSAVTRVALSNDQTHAEMVVLVLDAMERVSARPSHATRVAMPGGTPG